jgi:hypothetical protein
VWKWTEPMRNRQDVVELFLIVGVILATLIMIAAGLMGQIRVT